MASKKNKKKVAKGQASEKAAPTQTKEQEFHSMCGSDFNAAKNSVCRKECSQENPESFSACEENFKLTKQTKKAKPKKDALGMNAWGHRNGCQGDRIDQLIAG